MGLLSRFENKMEDGIEGAMGSLGSSALSPVQIMKKCEKEMRREKVVGAGRQYAPTLYTVLVSKVDDAKMSGYYPTLAGETETFLVAKARETGCVMDGAPLVRFLVEPGLRKGKFDVVAEMVSSPIIAKLRDDENRRYGIEPQQQAAPSHAPNSPRNRNMKPNLQPLHNLDNAPSQNAFANQQPQRKPMTPETMGAPEMIASQSSEIKIVDIPTYVGAPITQDDLREVYLYDEERDTAYQLASGVALMIGRGNSNDIVVPDINISRVHAQIEQKPDGSWVVTDLNSTNGVYVNDVKVHSAVVQDGDMISLGTSQLELQVLE